MPSSSCQASGVCGYSHSVSPIFSYSDRAHAHKQVRGLGIKSWQQFFSFFFARLIDHEENMEIYKWKWMVLRAIN